MARSDFRFFHTLRVRWAEVDRQDVVFNGHYLLYFDVAVTEYWRALQQGQSDQFKAQIPGWMHSLYAVKSTVEYHASAHFDEEIDIGVRIKKLGNSSMLWGIEIYHGEQHLTSGELVYVYRDPATEKSGPIPVELRGALEGF